MPGSMELLSAAKQQSSHCAVRMVAKANAALQVQTQKARYSTYLRLVLQFIMLISIRRVLATTFS